MSTTYLPQLDSLIINTFRKIVSLNDRDVTQKDIDILKALYDLEDNSISALSKENTQRKREYWQYIEKIINEWKNSQTSVNKLKQIKLYHNFPLLSNQQHQQHMRCKVMCHLPKVIF